MPKNYWYFQTDPSIQELRSIAEGMQSIKAIVLGLGSSAGFKASIVYPAPWRLGVEEESHLENWFDYYLKALALKSEHPDRVQLVPLDVFLKQHGISYKKYQPDEADAVCLRLSHSEHMNLMDQLEKSADFDDRPRLTFPKLGKVSGKKLTLIKKALHSGEVLEDHERLVGEQNIVLEVLKQQILSLEKSLNLALAERYSAEEKVGDMRSENEFLTAQLHQVQEEMERYFLENQALKKEMADTMEIVKEAYRTLQPAK